MNVRTVSLLLVGAVCALGGCGLKIESKTAKKERLEREKDDKQAARVTAYRDKIEKASCDDLVTTYRSLSGSADDYTSSTAKDTRVALARKFVECKKNAELFSCAGNTMGSYFNDAEKAGVDVKGALKSYLASPSKKGMFEVEACPGDDGYSRTAVYKWLRGRSDDWCADFVGAMESEGPAIRASIVEGYLLPKKCGGAAKLAAKGLQANPVWAKEATCAYLGEYGDDSYIEDLETVAKAHNERVVTNDGRVVFPVHDVCMKAAANLKLKKREARAPR